MVKITIDVAPEILRGILVTAIEGGSNYWARFANVQQDDHLYYLGATLVDEEADGPEERRTHQVSPETIRVGLERLASAVSTGKGIERRAAARHFADAITEDGDATTADVVLQMGVFGEVLYG